MSASGEVDLNLPACRFRLPRGEDIAVRPIRPADAGLLQAYVRGLSSEARRNRFLGAVGELSTTRLEELTGMDCPGEVALLAFVDAQETRVIAEAILVKMVNSQRCEIALSVADLWQKKGVGTLLLRNLECRARRLGVRFLFGDVFRTNTAMKSLARKEGFSIRTPFTDARLVEVGKDLSIPPSDFLCMTGRTLRDQPSRGEYAWPVSARPDPCGAAHG